MNPILGALVVGLAFGVLTGWIIGRAVERRAAREAHPSRAVLGLPERDAVRPGAKGRAKIHEAEYRQRDAEHGMQQ